MVIVEIIKKAFNWRKEEGAAGRKVPMLGSVYIWMLAVLLFGVVFHAPLSVWLGTIFPDYSLLIKSWKEILMGVAGVILVVLLTTYGRWGIFKSKLFYAIAGFAVLNIALVPVFYTGLESTLVGLLVNLRYMFAFTLVYAGVRLYGSATPLFLISLVSAAVISLLFAFLQVTVLPDDILKHIGYGASTIMPYLMVDQNPDFVRINGTMRGANPLGAFLVMAFTAVFVLWIYCGKVFKDPVVKRWMQVALPATLVLMAAVLWFTYSRSSMIGVFVAILAVFLIVYGKRLNKWIWISLAGVGLVTGGLIYANRDTDFVSTVILHADPAEAGEINSNDQHIEAFERGLGLMFGQPLGGGIGSTGSASLLTEKPLVIENQYLFIAHEVGWPGLVLFVAIIGSVLVILWRDRRDAVSLVVFASGIGLSAIGFIQPVWIDDTVSIVWWGLAGLAVARIFERKVRLKNGK